MTHEESPMLPQESLAVIAEAISKTKENFRENASYFLLWGWLIATASGLFFLLHAYTGFRYYFLPFPILAGAGIVSTLALYSRRKAEAHSETYLGYFFMRMWLGNRIYWRSCRIGRPRITALCVHFDHCRHRDAGVGIGDEVQTADHWRSIVFYFGRNLYLDA
jgi:hypothetical protein